MKLPYLDFQTVYPLAEIIDLVRMLNLPVKGTANMRCKCPVHDGDDRTLSITPSAMANRSQTMGVFKCWATNEGGDRIGLVAHCMELSQQEAAHFIKEQFGTVVPDRDTKSHRETVPDRDTVPANPRQAPQASTYAFDPDKFASRLVYHEDLRELGLDEAMAKELAFGFHPQQKWLYIPVRWPTGQVAGWLGFRKGESLKIPPRWIPAPTNVVALPRRA